MSTSTFYLLIQRNETKILFFSTKSSWCFSFYSSVKPSFLWCRSLLTLNENINMLQHFIKCCFSQRKIDTPVGFVFQTCPYSTSWCVHLMLSIPDRDLQNDREWFVAFWNHNAAICHILTYPNEMSAQGHFQQNHGAAVKAVIELNWVDF